MILIRVDSNKIIGSGHMMRCLSIAEAAKEEKIDCRFVASRGSVVVPIKQQGFSFDILQTELNEMEREIPQLLSIVEKLKPQLLIVDSYYVTNHYFEEVKKYVKVAYIDDLAVSDYPVDFLINYNLFGVDIDYQKLYKNKNVPQLLLGPAYAPLRKEFENVDVKEQPKAVQNILISTGGADSRHIALDLIRYLVSHPEEGKTRKYHFVIGGMNGDADQIRRLSKNHPNILLHQNVKNMKALMCQCDIAVSAAGSTLYELCACGVPTITYVLADNQVAGAEAFAKRGIMISLGDCRGDLEFPKKVFREVNRISQRQSLRKKMTRMEEELVDGLGVEQILEIVKESIL